MRFLSIPSLFALPSIRSRLIAIVLATAIPSAIALGVLAATFYGNQKKQSEIDLLQTARALTSALDRNFSIGLNVAQALAVSSKLQQSDFAGFHAEAKSVLNDRFPGFTFVLSDESGQQLLNTIRPYGEALPRHGDPEHLRQVFLTGKPSISDLYMGGVMKRPVVSIEVPVWRDGKVAYVLSVGFLTDSLTRILTDQRLPEGRMAAIFDPQGVIAARTHMAEQLVGKKGAPVLLQRIETATEGIVETRTLEGLDVIIAFNRSTETNWTVGISMPWTVVLAETLNQIALLYGAIVVLLAAGVATVWIIGGKISRSIRALAAPAIALGTGAPVVVLDHGPSEAIEISQTLKAVERELQQYRDHLEQMVAERTAALQASNRELEQFAYVASHDLQEPLRMVVSYVDLLARRYGDKLDKDAFEFIGFAREGALRMSELIKDLLDYSRIGRQDGHPEILDLRELATEALNNLRLALTDSGGTVVLADTLPTLVGNRVELVRLFQNLIGNALKYRRPDQPPRVEIKAERDGTAWVIKVADNGIGIAPEYRERIFGLFQRLHGRSAYQGTGIGLASAKKIVELHGGRIWVQDAPGQGSVFCFTLEDKPSLPVDMPPAQDQG